VASIEIEGYLAGHPAIEVVQVVGVPDSHYGEVPAAFIQLRNGTQLSVEDVQAFCIGRIAGFKVPRHVRFVTEWPMSGTKIKKFELQARLVEELERAGIDRAPKIQSRIATPALRQS
jgi:fatty-acyl-CoA synthase